MNIFFRKYYLAFVWVLPLFFLATTVQHSVDIENFTPVEQTGTNNPFDASAEVSEENSSEDDIHSLMNLLTFLNQYSPEPGYIIKGESINTKNVPSPPPDIV